MGEEAGRAGADTGQRQRLLIRFGMDGDVRFISHHDTVRLFRRALARAGLPVRFTEGFNPHPRLQLPVPRPVGIAARGDVLLIELDRPVPVVEVASRLAAQLPAGVTLAGAEVLPTGARFEPVCATYQLPVEAPDSPSLPERMRQLLIADVVPVDRHDPQGHLDRQVDVRPYLAQLWLAGNAVRFTLHITPRGTARPAEIVRLLGLEPETVQHRICRTSIQWQVITKRKTK